MFRSTIAKLLACAMMAACGANAPEKKETDHQRKSDVNVIPGTDQLLDSVIVQKGQVLIAYSDCYTCHSTENSKKGPAFSNIAKRYPANSSYIELLALKIIRGGRGAWGNSVMEPHPQINIEEARAMATYILSLEN